MLATYKAFLLTWLGKTGQSSYMLGIRFPSLSLGV